MSSCSEPKASTKVVASCQGELDDNLSEKTYEIPVYYEDNYEHRRGRNDWPYDGPYDDFHVPYCITGMQEDWYRGGAGMTAAPSQGSSNWAENHRYPNGNGYRGHNRHNQHRRGKYGGYKHVRNEHEEKDDSSKPITRSPSPSYLAVTLEPSYKCGTPSRKLLILDLNGTILLRLKPRHTPPSRRLQGKEEVPSSSPPYFQRLKRVIYPRPYLPSFREYLLHPNTKAWLDVMIWSSAQPHSVKSMLEHCFPEEEKASESEVQNINDGKGPVNHRFIAVWARDTLGLSTFDYSRKIQTTKDLRKPWSQLPTVMVNQSPEDEDTSNQPGEQQPFRHSEKTTILLDDSPLKAQLQPWNHICLQEYDSIARNADIKSLREQNCQVEHTKQNAANIEDSVTANEPNALKAPVNEPHAIFDSNLLAVIGILECIKYESNVAGWIRSNGFQGKIQQPLPTEAQAIEPCNDADDEDNKQSIPLVSLSRPKRSLSRESHGPPPVAKRPRLDPEIVDVPTQTDEHTNSIPRNAMEGALRNFELPVTDEYLTSGTQAARNFGQPDTSNASQHDTHLTNQLSDSWFTEKGCFKYWVALGKEALLRLGIEEQHGVIDNTTT